jgi:hypothetical protein
LVVVGRAGGAAEVSVFESVGRGQFSLIALQYAQPVTGRHFATSASIACSSLRPLASRGSTFRKLAPSILSSCPTLNFTPRYLCFPCLLRRVARRYDCQRAGWIALLSVSSPRCSQQARPIELARPAPRKGPRSSRSPVPRAHRGIHGSEPCKTGLRRSQRSSPWPKGHPSR